MPGGTRQPDPRQPDPQADTGRGFFRGKLLNILKGEGSTGILLVSSVPLACWRLPNRASPLQSSRVRRLREADWGDALPKAGAATPPR